jgi:hypothetical protein
MLATPIETTRDKLYAIMQTLGPGWHDRPEIAAKLGKKVLNPVDVAALDLLASEGKIQKQVNRCPLPDAVVT